jgi:hypothetical protein
MMPPLVDEIEVWNKSPDQKSQDQVLNLSGYVDASPLYDDWMGQFWEFNRSEEMIPDDIDELSDEEVSRASSSDYFDQEDFVGWQSSYIPPMSFAVFLGGLVVVTHPFLAAGALTAFGTAKACMSEESMCSDGWFIPISEEDEPSQARESDQLEAKQLMSRHISEVIYDLGGSPKMKLLTIEQQLPHQSEEEEEQQQPSQESEELPLDPSTLETAEEALEWVDRHYPPLAQCAKKNIALAGLNALEFFNVFFANDAPFTFEELQRKREDKDIRYGRWESLENVNQASLHPKACKSLGLSMQERLLQFKTKTNSFFGPPFADATKLQRALVASKKLLVLEATTTLKDVPFCDRFYITERWVVTAEKTDQVYCTSLSIYFEVVFTESCPFESQIVSSSKKTFVEIANRWIEMARQALQLTEEARTNRLEQTKTASTTLSNEEAPLELAIEVRHTGKLQSSVIEDEVIGDLPKRSKPKRMLSFRRIISKMGSFPKMLARKRSTPSTSPSSTSPSSSFHDVASLL